MRDVRHELLFLSPYLGISFLRNHFSWRLYKSLFRWAIDRVNVHDTLTVFVFDANYQFQEEFPNKVVQIVPLWAFIPHRSQKFFAAS